MKINSELERILLAQQQAQTAKTKSADSSAAFDDILQNALQKPDATSPNEEISLTSLGISNQHMNAQKAETAQSAPMGGAAPMTGTSAEDEEENDEYDVLSLMADIENSLSGLDEYTKKLAKSQLRFRFKASMERAFSFQPKCERFASKLCKSFSKRFFIGRRD